MTDARRIKQMLRERVLELAQYLFPNGHPEGNHWCVGSINGEPGKSFKICIAGEKAGLYGDFGDLGKPHSRNLLNLWMAARNVDFKTAMREAAEWLGEPLNQSNGAPQSVSKTRSTSIFRTLKDAIVSTERRLNMRATRRDWYHDRNGNEHFVVVRFDGDNTKDFRPFCRNGSGWIAADPPGKLPLFRLPELIIRPGNLVFIVEGEKCSCEVATLGLLVITSAHGAKSAHKTDWQPLAGRKVVILPDNDPEGCAYAQTVAGILTRLSPPATVQIVELPDLPPKGDCVDWLDARDAQTPEDITAELLGLVKNAEYAKPETSHVGVQSLGEDERENENRDKRESDATALVKLVQSKKFCLFHDPQDRPFVRFQNNGHTEVWPVESAKFRKLLGGIFYQVKKRSINRNALGDAVTTLAGLACYDGKEEPVFLRVAPHGYNILIDICDPQWRVIEITPNGWRVLEKSPLAFIRTGSMQALPEPVSGGSIEPLWDLLNVTEAQRPLVAGSLLNAFHPHGPYFVTNYVGEQGTAKTCGARIQRQLVDPNENPLRSPPKEERDLIAQAASNRCVALDNLSSLPQWLSDALCRLATGGGHSARTLYTDLEEISLAVKRPVILNGIEDVATRPDLAERALQIELETISDYKRISEKELWQQFNEQHAVIFSGLLDGLVRALRDLPELKYDSLPRMADAALWATAGETAFGWPRGTFLAAYRQNLDEGAIASVEAHPVGVAILKLLDQETEWSGEPAQLMQAINGLVSEEQFPAKAWPKNALSLGHCLRRLAPAFRRAGIAYERDRGTRRIIHLCKAREKTSESSEPSENRAEKDDQDVSDDLSGDLHGVGYEGGR
jgi:putative DNA primase/helicase